MTTVGKPYTVGTSNLLENVDHLEGFIFNEFIPTETLLTFDNLIFVKTTIILTSPTIKFLRSISLFSLKAMDGYKNP